MGVGAVGFLGDAFEFEGGALVKMDAIGQDGAEFFGLGKVEVLPESGVADQEPEPGANRTCDVEKEVAMVVVLAPSGAGDDPMQGRGRRGPEVTARGDKDSAGVVVVTHH